eukprot:PhM_4_TR5487/c0_g1_i1/m.55125
MHLLGVSGCHVVPRVAQRPRRVRASPRQSRVRPEQLRKGLLQQHRVELQLRTRAARELLRLRVPRKEVVHDDVVPRRVAEEAYNVGAVRVATLERGHGLFELRQLREVGHNRGKPRGRQEAGPHREHLLPHSTYVRAVEYLARTAPLHVLKIIRHRLLRARQTEHCWWEVSVDKHCVRSAALRCDLENRVVVYERTVVAVVGNAAEVEAVPDTPLLQLTRRVDNHLLRRRRTLTVAIDEILVRAHELRTAVSSQVGIALIRCDLIGHFSPLCHSCGRDLDLRERLAAGHLGDARTSRPHPFHWEH